MTTKKTIIRDLRDAIRATGEKKAKGYFAMLGNLAGEVLTAIPNMVYVTTFEGQTKTVINRRVPNDLGSVVFVGSDDYSANKIEVLYSLNLTGSTNDGQTLTGSNVAQHSHGYDSVNPSWIQSAQFLPLLTLPYSGLTVQVYPGVIRTSSGGVKWFAGEIVDLTSYYPASGALWATIQIEDAGTTTIEVGATAAERADLDETDIPAETTGKRIIAIILDAGFDELFRNNVRNDFLDLRFFALDASDVGIEISSDDADIAAVNFLEQISDPAAPGANHRIIYAKSDGMYERDSAGVVVGPLGSGSGVGGQYRQFVTISDGAGGWEFVTFDGEPVLILQDLE